MVALLLKPDKPDPPEPYSPSSVEDRGDGTFKCSEAYKIKKYTKDTT